MSERAEPDVKLAEKRRVHRQALSRTLDEITARLAQHGDVERAILFGSYARGQEDLFTDLDLVIVMRSGEDFVNRTAQMYAYLAPEVDVDLLVYTPAEFEAQRRRRFLRQALQEGRVIYEKQRP